MNKILILLAIICSAAVINGQEASDLPQIDAANSIDGEEEDADGCLVCDDNCDFGHEKDSRGCSICNQCKTEGLIEGDILIASEGYPEYVRRYKEDCISKNTRGAIVDERYKWPKNSDGNVYVPYTFEGSVSSTKQGRIENVFRQYAEKTCIRFTRRRSERNFLKIQGTGGCSSYVGRQFFREQGQAVTIGNGCDNAQGTIIHELMHALGFWHEQSRGDRDQYVRVLHQNIRPGTEGNFEKQTNYESYETEYDVGSVMHYGGTFFSRNGEPTIVHRGTNRPVVANRRDFSPTDLEEINRRYECSRFTGGSVTPTSSTTTPTRPTVGTGTGSCADRSSNCAFWKRQSYCEVNFVEFMRRNCPSTCRFCNPTTTRRPATTRPPRTTQPPRTTTRRPGVSSCRNRLSSCSQLTQQCRSTSQNWIEFMQRNCPQTCNLCTGTTRPPTTTRPPANCRNTQTNTNCDYWQSRGYCTSSTFSSFMRRSCPRTCGFCGTSSRPTTTQPPVTGNARCGRPTVGASFRTMMQRIVGGTEAEYGSIPWIVSLRRGTDYDFCAGALVSDRFLVTAAHCFYRGNTFYPDVSRLHGYAGKHQRKGINHDDHQKRIDFSEVHQHPSYNHVTSDNDIAVLELRESVEFTNYIIPVCLPSQNEATVPSTTGIVSGWGNTKTDGFPDVLQKVNVEIVSNTNCNRWLRRRHDNGRDEVTNNMFCAGYQRGGRDSCQGDSGGPLTVRKSDGSYVLTGVVSWGYSCGEVDRPGVYAKVSNYVNWINGIIN